MNLRTVLLIISLTIGFFQLALGQNKFNIKGTAPAIFNGKKVYLDYIHEGNSMSDSVVIKNGTFSFKGTVDEPAYSRMVFDSKAVGKGQAQYIGDRLYLYIGNETYKIAIIDSIKTATITGSPTHVAYKNYLSQIGGCFIELMDNAGKEFAAVNAKDSNANEQYANIKSRYDSHLAERRKKEIAFAQKNPKSIFAMDALLDVANAYKMSEVEPLFLALSLENRQSRRGQELAARIEASKTIHIGNAAPDFSEPDVNGKTITLSDFKGKYIILDFWASWCVPCRAENPNLKKAYLKYKDQGLEVIAVSVDDNRGKQAWIDAIAQDELTWINTSELKGFSGQSALLYGIRAVPSNFLIDPNGKIIAKDLKQEKLHQVLGEIFNK